MLLNFDIDFRVTFEDSLEGVWIHSATLETLESYISLRILESLLFLCWFERVYVLFVYL